MSGNEGGSRNEPATEVHSSGSLSARADALPRVVTIIAAITGVIATVLAFVLASPGDGNEPPPQDNPARTTTTTIVPTYDIDSDGRADFALIEDQVVAAPADGNDSGLPTWLPFAGTVLAAALAAAATLGVAWLNRDGGRKVDALEARLKQLESPPAPLPED